MPLIAVDLSADKLMVSLDQPQPLEVGSDLAQNVFDESNVNGL